MMTNRQFLTNTRLLLGGALVALLAATFILRSGLAESHRVSAAESNSASPLSVNTVVVKSVKSFQRERRYTGSLLARRTTELGFERSARLMELLVDEGATVRADQELARLDVRRLETRRLELVAQRAAAEATLSEMEAGPRKETIAAARANVVALKADLELRQRNHARYRKLRDQNAVSQQLFEEAYYGWQVAYARFKAALRELDELEAGTRSEKLAAQRAQIKQLDASLADVELDRADSVLRSPFAGRIAVRYMDEGTVVTPQQPIFRIVETGVLEARIGLPISRAAQLELGKAVQLTVEGAEYQATFSRLLPEVDLRTRTQLAVFDLDASQAKGLAPGQVVRFASSHEVAAVGFWLPTTALSPGLRGLWSAFAVVNQDGKPIIERRLIEVLHTSGNRVLVRGTLQEGDQVVADGVQRIVPGQHVSVKD